MPKGAYKHLNCQYMFFMYIKPFTLTNFKSKTSSIQNNKWKSPL